MTTRHEFSKYDFALTIAALRAMKHSLDLAWRLSMPFSEPSGELAKQIQRVERLIDLLDSSSTAWIEK
jgi:hypothetical protein